jgi:double-strand break repair protein AddB
MPDPAPPPLFAGPGPRLFALPPGADFARAVAAGLRARLAGAPPEALARVEILANAAPTLAALRAAFAEGPPALLPRLRTLDELAFDPRLAEALPPPVPPLRRRLELARLVQAALRALPDIAPPTAAFALARSLADLLDEMEAEGIPPDGLLDLDLGAHSAHWDRARRLVLLARDHLAADTAPPGPEGRLRLAVEHLSARWAADPPGHPVLVVGSTGSRAAAARLIAAVARLPQGAAVLPGVDPDLPRAVWRELAADPPPEEHPQTRIALLAAALGLDPSALPVWDGSAPPDPARGRLISLALRPAPVTDAWMEEGAALGDPTAATAALALIEAADPRREAEAIALLFREAAERGERAALVTPDRTLARRVTAALDRWGIVPDDSAGVPLALTPPGRFLLHTAGLEAPACPAEALIALLKHPLCHAGAGRGPHLLHTRNLELHLRRHGPPAPDRGALAAWAGADPDRAAWAGWLSDRLESAPAGGSRPLAEALSAHRALAEALAAGPGGAPDALWSREAGAEALAALDALAREAAHGPEVTPAEYRALLSDLFAERRVPDPVTGRPDLRIAGPREARTLAADLVVIAGLNEGVWPAQPPADPWLSRPLRRAAGLLSPERSIGLAAHDFQIAAAAPRVVLTRALRDAEAATVPSRWLSRIVTLLEGLTATGGPAALSAMRARGARVLALAEALARPAARVAPARRPAPCPPVTARPRRLRVTEVQTLIRDPYAIYAGHVLRLAPLAPLRAEPDARLRGQAIHRVFEVFLSEQGLHRPDPIAAFRDCLARVLSEDVPWPAARAVWSARLMRLAPWFLATESRRTAAGQATVALEVPGRLPVPGSSVTLTGKADRIDRLPDGRAVIYDYKTGALPGRTELEKFDKQLPLLAAMAEAGAFDPPGRVQVARVGHIGVGSSPGVAELDLPQGHAAAALAELAELLADFDRPDHGYQSRRAVKARADGDAGDYDHLARHGEWSDADPPFPEAVP